MGAIRLYHHASLPSTEDEARRLIAAGEREPFAVLSDVQTAARGRLGRPFYAGEGGLYLTVAGATDDLVSAVTVTSAAAVFCCRALEDRFGLSLGIKWVNDLIYVGKKAAGILTEAFPRPDGRTAVLVGIGINLTTGSFPEYLCDTAISLMPGRTLASKTVEELALALADDIVSYLSSPDPADWREEYRARSVLTDRAVTYYENGVSHTARVRGIGDRGELLVEENGIPRALFSGEITVRLS